MLSLQMTQLFTYKAKRPTRLCFRVLESSFVMLQVPQSIGTSFVVFELVRKDLHSGLQAHSFD